MAVTHSNRAVPFMFTVLPKGKENPAILRDTPALSWMSFKAMGNEAADEAVVKAVNRAVPIIFMKTNGFLRVRSLNNPGMVSNPCKMHPPAMMAA